MSLRLTAVLAAAAAAVLAAPATGAMRQVSQVVDPKGDARGNLGFADVVTGVWHTRGTGDAKALVATLTLSGPARTDVGVTYELRAAADGCGTVSFSYSPGTVSASWLGPQQLYLGCGGTDALGSVILRDEVSVSVRGRAITWSVPLRALPPQVGVGTYLSAFQAVADVADPVMGHPAGRVPGQSIDLGHGHTVWRIR